MGFVYTLSLLYQIAHVGLKEKPCPVGNRRGEAAGLARQSAGSAHVTNRFVVMSAPPNAVDPEPAQANMSRFELLTALRF
jgi:hypothetical protein